MSSDCSMYFVLIGKSFVRVVQNAVNEDRLLFDLKSHQSPV